MNPLQGSLSSLSFTDIYGLSTTTPPDPAMLDLHRRVDKILNNAQVEQKPLHHQQAPPTIKSPESGLQSAEESLTTPESETSSSSFLSPQMLLQHFTTTTTSPSPHHYHHQQQSSHSPRSSLSSVSPPVSPHVSHSEVVMPPSYDLAYLGSSSAAAQRLRAQQEARNVAEQLADLRLGASSKLSTISENLQCGLDLEYMLNQQYGGGAVETVPVPPLSPIAEVAAAGQSAR